VFGAATALHECDHILSYIVRYSSRSASQGPEGGLQDYFEGGKRDALMVEALMSKLGLQPDSSVLEFAAGFGRVTRHLTHYKLTACDIHEEAVRFLQQEIHVKAIPSTTNPNEFALRNRFDFIFVLSLFSHLPANLFGLWLSRLTELLVPGGYLMLTTHGEAAGKKVKALGDVLDNESGFGFLPNSDQGDLTPEVYGSSIVTPKYVIERVFHGTKARIASFSPGVWWDLQDEWVIRSDPAVN
jgi:SAM-dependent methyltransferase